MPPRILITRAQSEAAIDLFEAGIGYVAAASRLDAPEGSLKNLHDRWLVRGRRILTDPRTRAERAPELKIEVARRYLAGEDKVDLAREHGLLSTAPVRSWARAYRREGEKAFQPGPRKPRATTKRMQQLTRGDDPDGQCDHPSKPDLMAGKSSADEISLAEYRQLQQRLLRAEAEAAYLKKLWALKRNRQQ